jgi:hypothetical protein
MSVNRFEPGITSNAALTPQGAPAVEEVVMGESYAERAAGEGPLPGTEDDSELVGEDEKSSAAGARKEHGGDFTTMPTAGAGAFPVTMAADDMTDDETPADQEAER